MSFNSESKEVPSTSITSKHWIDPSDIYYEYDVISPIQAWITTPEGVHVMYVHVLENSTAQSTLECNLTLMTAAPNLYVSLDRLLSFLENFDSKKLRRNSEFQQLLNEAQAALSISKGSNV